MVLGGDSHDDECTSDYTGVCAANRPSLEQMSEGFTAGDDVVLVCHIL